MNPLLPPEMQIGGAGGAISRADAKSAIMTHWYGSVLEVAKVFGNGYIRDVFYHVMQHLYKGPTMLFDYIRNVWSEEALQHIWTLPDGHVAVADTKVDMSGTFHIESVDYTMDFRWESNRTSDNSTPLLANITHSKLI